MKRGIMRFMNQQRKISYEAPQLQVVARDGSIKVDPEDLRLKLMVMQGMLTSLNPASPAERQFRDLSVGLANIALQLLDKVPPS